MMPESTAVGALQSRTYKKPYRKSITGCTACKARKIKCDESRPTCSNCRRRYTDPSCCIYLPLDARERNIRGASKRTSVSNSRRLPLEAGVSFRPVGMESSNLLQLRLMHHYTKSTCFRQRSAHLDKTLVGQALWEVDIPQVAFSSPLVLNALLGISACHLWSLSPTDQNLAKVSRLYFGKALQLQRRALEEGKEQDVEAIYMAAIVLAHHCWLLYHSGERREAYQIPLETYYMCNGHRALAEKAGRPFSIYEFFGDHVPKEQARESPRQYPQFWHSAREDMKFLLERAEPARLGRADGEIYTKVAEEIKHIYYLIADGFEETSVIEDMIVTILHRVPPKFISLIEKKDPLAMGLITRNFALLGLLKNTQSWWIHGDGQWKVANCSVHGIQSIMPPDWLWVMQWPLEVLSGDIGLV